MALRISLSRYAPFGIGALYLLLATPTARTLLEATMSTHMLVQIPLLVAAGIVAGRLLPERYQGSLLADAGGAIPCVVLAIFASSYWMLPRALDSALANPLTEAAKFITLPALAGLPLALAWKQLSAIGRGFVWTNFISMLAVLGWLYIAAPVRLCNSYLLDQQTGSGWLMIKIAMLLLAGWLGMLFIGGDSAPPESGAAEGTVNLTRYAELAAAPRTNC
jgi:hypothetical protein